MIFQLHVRLLGIALLAFGAAVHADMVADFAKNPEILQAQISPRGDYVAVLREVDEKRAVFVFSFPEMKHQTVMSFPGRNEVGSFRWVNDERIVASVTQNFDRFISARGTGELFGINADGSKPEHLFGFRAGADKSSFGHTRQVSNQFASARIINTLDDNPKEVLVNIRHWSRGFNNVVEAARMNVYTGRLTGKVRAPVSGASLVADPEGNIRFSYATDDDQSIVVHVRDPKTRKWQEFSRTPYGEATTVPISARPDGRLLVEHTPDEGPQGLFLMDPKTQQLEELYRHSYVDANPLFDRDRVLYGAMVMPGEAEFISLDNKHPHARLLKQVKKALPDGFPLIANATRNKELTLVYVDYDTKTPEVYLFDSKKKELSLVFDSRPWMNDSQLAEIRPIQLKARDGLQLHGYLSVPPGVEAKNLPLIVVPHGGPHGPRDTPQYDWFHGIIPASGYAMLRINFRGSGGYGNHFETLGHGEWGKKMQDDVTDATQWAIDQGVADPERICIFGWSYGGYATLMGIQREPDLYRCAVGGAGVYDQEVQYRQADFASLTRWGKKYMDKVIGPTAQDRVAASPTNYVDRIKTPLLLVHGDKDVRVPVEHVNALQKAMRKAGKPAPQTLILKKEAHTPRSEENLEKMWRTILAFFETHIGPGAS